ncbi:MAG: TonB-dependent receptor, partial [Gemmatimonadota bacterium]
VYTDARTGGTINGANETDDGIKEIGGYVHSVTRLSPKFDIVSALRIDKNSRLESAVLSPRVGVVFKLTPDQNLRFTYNRSFSTPSDNNLFLDIVAGAAGPYSVRALGVPAEGFHFRAGGGCAGGVGNLCMRTPFVPTAGLLPANAAALWQVAIGFLLQSPLVPTALKPLLQSIPAPTTQVATVLRALNPTTAAFAEVTPDQVRDIDRLKPTISNSFEAGYKAIFNSKFKLAIDAWYEHKRNFVGPLIVETPNVFLDPATLGAYLASKGVPTQALSGLVTSMAGIPLGTVVPNDGGKLTQRPDIFLTYRNFGTVNIFGSDLALDYIASDRFSVSGTYSWVNKDFFPQSEVGGLTDVALNAAKSKGSATFRFRNDRQGWGSELRFRAVAGFPVNSGVYVGKTDGYGVVDLGGTYRPPVGARNLLLAVNVANLFNHGYATFVGVPQLGRLVLTKVSYTF